jgi:hypothetical protein
VEAVIGLAGIVVGALLGATGTYFRLRRDAWIEARANALLLLADVRALRHAKATDEVVARTQLGVKTWDARAEALVRYRRGNYPSGLRAGGWLELAGHFARLRTLGASTRRPDASWWREVQKELTGAHGLLTHFEKDEPVLAYVIVTGAREGRNALLALAIFIALALVFVFVDLAWWVGAVILLVAITIVAVFVVPWWKRTGRGASA